MVVKHEDLRRGSVADQQVTQFYPGPTRNEWTVRLDSVQSTSKLQMLGVCAPPQKLSCPELRHSNCLASSWRSTLPGFYLSYWLFRVLIYLVIYCKAAESFHEIRITVHSLGEIHPLNNTDNGPIWQPTVRRSQ